MTSKSHLLSHVYRFHHNELPKFAFGGSPFLCSDFTLFGIRSKADLSELHTGKLVQKVESDGHLEVEWSPIEIDGFFLQKKELQHSFSAHE
jgi:hypothetical protein